MIWNRKIKPIYFVWQLWKGPFWHQSNNISSTTSKATLTHEVEQLIDTCCCKTMAPQATWQAQVIQPSQMMCALHRDEEGTSSSRTQTHSRVALWTASAITFCFWIHKHEVRWNPKGQTERRSLTDWAVRKEIIITGLVRYIPSSTPLHCTAGGERRPQVSQLHGFSFRSLHLVLHCALKIGGRRLADHYCLLLHICNGLNLTK